MSRISDYSSFSSQKSKKISSEHIFTQALNFLDIELVNRPPELADVDSAECEIEYEVGIDRVKSGIVDLSFSITNIEMDLGVDDYPNEQKEFEFDIVPGENIDHTSVFCRKMEKLIPCEPTKIRIDMKKSMNTQDFKIEVFFGNGE